MSSASESYSPGASREAWPTCARSSPGEISPVLSIVDVNEDNHLWEYDQLNIICPIISEEKHIISKPEFDSCWVFHPRPKIVAVCDRPRSFKYFTITFRSFSPSPGGLEFKPGHTYYFVSTSTINDVHRRAGGYCSLVPSLTHDNPPWSPHLPRTRFFLTLVSGPIIKLVPSSIDILTS